MIAHLPAQRWPIHLSAIHALPTAGSWRIRLAAGVKLPSRYLGSFGAAAVVLAVSAAAIGVAGWLRAGSFLAILAAGGVLATAAIVLLRPATTGTDSPPQPAVGGTGYESAFVCARCAEYTAPPDWDALFQESGPSGESGGLVPPGGWVVPAAVADRPAPEVPPELRPQTFGGHPSGPETVYLPPTPRKSVPLAIADSDLMLIEGRLMPVRLDGTDVAISGARGRSPHPRTATGGRPATIPRWAVYDFGGPSGAPPQETALPRDPDPETPTLDGWLRAEVDGLVRRSRVRSSGPADGSPATPGEATSELPAADDPTSVLPCAVCKEAVPLTSDALSCPDCRRPVCEPCRERVVEHDGRSWCAPCAVNRLSTEYLGVLEGPGGLADPHAEWYSLGLGRI